MIRNAPLLDDGTPMPTRYWLVDRRTRTSGCRGSKSAGGVRAAERDGRSRRAAGRARRATPSERDADLPATHAGPRPSRRRRRDPHRREVPARALRLSPRRRRRSGRAVGRGRARARRSRGRDDASRGDRHRDQLDPPARRRRRTDGRTRRSRPSSGTRGSPASVKASHEPRAAPSRTRSSARSPCSREYRRGSTRLGVERVRMTATSASRDATNRDEFFDAAEAVIGVRPELISARKRRALDVPRRDRRTRPSPGRTSWSTSAAARPSSSSAPTQPDGLLSVDIGCVRLTEQYLHGDPPDGRGAEPGRVGRARPPRRRRPRAARAPPARRR